MMTEVPVAVIIGVLAANLAQQTPTPEAGSVRNMSQTLSSGERVLRHEVEVDAPVAAVWRAFSTNDGLRGFAAPFVAIDLRPGGHWESSYNPAGHIGDPANILNQIIAYVPERMLAMRIARTPPGFPNPEVAKQVWTVIEMTDLGNGRTRATGSMYGWQQGAEWDTVYRFFERGNATVFDKLKRYLSTHTDR